MLYTQGGWAHLRLPAEFQRRMVITLPCSRREVLRKARRRNCTTNILWLQLGENPPGGRQMVIEPPESHK